METSGHTQQVFITEFEQELAQMTDDELDEFATAAARAAAYFEALDEPTAAGEPQLERLVPDPTTPAVA